MKVPSAAVVLSAFLLYCTVLQSQGIIIEGPQTIVYFPGQGPIELVCDATAGVILWEVNGASFSPPQLRNRELANHTAPANGTNIIIEVPLNNSEYVCTATTNDNEISSEPAFVYIAAVPDQVPNFTGMTIGNSMTLEGDLLNITLSWGEPFNNFDPILNYTVTCSDDARCPPPFITADNSTRTYNVYNLNATTTYVFSVAANNSLGSGDRAIFVIDPPTVPDEVTGLNLTCALSDSELYYTCTAQWNPVTIGNGSLEQPLVYRVYYNGYFENVTYPTTYVMFRAPEVPEGYFVSNVTVGVTAINRFGAGPPSMNVSAEIIAPSVIKVKATPDTDVPSERYDYTIVCIIDPDSTADTCEVTVRSGEMTMINSSMAIDGNATIRIFGLSCLEAYTVIAGGTLNDTLVGPRSSHAMIITGDCMVTVGPTTSTMTVAPTSSATPTPTEPVRDSGAAFGTACSIILVALTTMITMAMQW